MQLTRFSDYAIRLLVLLSLNEGQPVTVGAAAEHLGISKNHLIKVANLLVHNGYLTGSRGRKGGIHLNRSPSAITIGEILRITEPGFCLVDCMATPGSCTLERVCGVPAYLQKGMRAFFAAMDAARLSDVVCQSATGMTHAALARPSREPPPPKQG